MAVKEAAAVRLQQIMQECHMRANELAVRSGITPSGVYSMLDPHRKEVSVNLVKKLCDGLDISRGEFFAAQVFDALEQEMKWPQTFAMRPPICENGLKFVNRL